MQGQDTNKRAWWSRRWSWAAGVGAAGLVLACWPTISSMTLSLGEIDDTSLSEARGAVQPRARQDGSQVDLTRLGVVHGSQRRGRFTVPTDFWGHDHGEPVPAVAPAGVSRGDLKLLSSALEAQPKAASKALRPAAAARRSADPAFALATIDAVSRLLALASGESHRSQSSAMAAQPDAVVQSRPLPQARVLQAL